MDRIGFVRAVRLEPCDNVATLIGAARSGDAIGVANASDGSAVELVAVDDIGFGHKVALENIPQGTSVVKYGVAIARARHDVRKGAHVHVHNAESLVGTGHEANQAKAGNRSDGAPATDSAHGLIAAEELHATVLACLAASGVKAAPAKAMADHIVEAQLRGVETHGLRRLKPYLNRIRLAGVAADADPIIETEGALVRVDGRNGIGHHIATAAADAVAIAARKHGAAVALIRNSNHFGFAGYYATRIAEHGMLAMVTSNGQICVGPDGARKPLFSNDPVAIAAPFGRDGMIEFDMATSVTSRAKIAQAAERGLEIAPGLALDSNGQPTCDAKAAMEGVLLPFGGDKGFAFLIAIEALTGVLTGGAYADLVASKEAAPGEPEKTAHFMLAIDVQKAFGTQARNEQARLDDAPASSEAGAVNFKERLADLVNRVENLAMREGVEPPRPPGKRRWLLRAQRLSCGIPLPISELSALGDLAAGLNLARPRLLQQDGGDA